MEAAAQTEPLNAEKEERQIEIEDPDVAKTEDFPGTVSLPEPIKKVMIIMIIVMTILLLITNVAMFIVGITGTKNCTIQPNIPIYLIVAGILGIATKALTSVYFCRENIPLLNHIWHALITIEGIWMLVGSYWVYSIYLPNFIKAPNTPYCSKTVYYVAFGILTGHYVLGILVGILTCCIVFGFFYKTMTSTTNQ